MEAACKEAEALVVELAQEGKIQVAGALFEGSRPIVGLLKGCKALVFLWTLKAGLGLGISTGHGFVIRYHNSRWTAPCFVKTVGGKAGAVLGVAKVSTLMAAMTSSLVDKLSEAGRVLEGDINMELWPVTTADSKSSEKFSFVSFADVVSLSTGTSVMFDWSAGASSLTVDEGRNKEAYGEGITARAILSGEVERPAEMLPLCQRIAMIIQSDSAGQ